MVVVKFGKVMNKLSWRITAMAVAFVGQLLECHKIAINDEFDFMQRPIKWTAKALSSHRSGWAKGQTSYKPLTKRQWKSDGHVSQVIILAISIHSNGDWVGYGFAELTNSRPSTLPLQLAGHLKRSFALIYHNKNDDAGILSHPLSMFRQKPKAIVGRLREPVDLFLARRFSAKSAFHWWG